MIELLLLIADNRDSFVRKPVLFEEFVRSVSTVGCYWLLLNEPPR